MNSLKLKIQPIIKWLRSNKVHIISWTLFMFWESVIAGFFFNVFGKLGNYAIHYALNISFFYLHAWLLKDATKYTHTSKWKLPLYVILELLAYVFIVYQVDNFLAEYTDLLGGTPGPFISRLSKLLYRATFFMLFATGYFFLKRYLQEKEEKLRIEKLRFQALLDVERAEKDLLVSKNAFLKAQINPHLLFNTFEFLHQKLRRHTPEDAKVMVYLSDMLRFASSTEHQDGTIRLGDEIEQAHNLIRIYRHTHEEAFVTLACSDDVAILHLIPLVIMTVLENILKHGLVNDPARKATLDIYIHEQKLWIESRNWPNILKHKVGFGSGLDNIRSRLNYSYGGGATITAGMDEEGYYTLQITIETSLLEPEMLPLASVKANV